MLNILTDFNELQAQAYKAIGEPKKVKTVSPFSYFIHKFGELEGYIKEEDTEKHWELIDLLENCKNYDDIREREWWRINEHTLDKFNELHTALEIYEADDEERAQFMEEASEEAEDELMGEYQDFENWRFRTYTKKGRAEVLKVLNSQEFTERYNNLLLLDKISATEEETRRKFLELLQGSKEWTDRDKLQEVLDDPAEYFKPVAEFLGI